MKNIKIAIISDLHCMHGKQHPMKTLLYSDAPIIPASDHPVQALMELIDNEALECDYVVCPGDIANSMDKQGIISGYGYVESIKTKLKASLSFYTPGNHDRDSRNKLNSSYSAEPLRQLVENYPLKADDNLINQFWANGFCIYTDSNAAFLLIDSTYTHTTKDNAERSIIPPNILDMIEKDLKSRDCTNLFRIAVCHHHPLKISNADCTDYKDTDAIENGDRLIKILEENNFNVLIHGHKHTSQLIMNETFPILSSGSFSAVENILESGSSNTFHILELIINDSLCRGKITTWIFKRKFGWQKGFDVGATLPSNTGFGCFEPATKLATSINGWISSQNKERIRYSDLVQAFPDLDFLTPLQQKRISTELLSKYNLEFLPELSIGPKYIAKQIIEQHGS